MAILTVTEKAISEVKNIIAEQSMDPEKVALRVRVVGGGCSGFQTKLDIDEVFDEAKDEIETVDGVKIAVDKRSAMYLSGATVDFHSDLNKRGFSVDVPGTSGRCGCGSSFSM